MFSPSFQISVMAMLRAGRSGVQIPAGARCLSLLHLLQTRTGVRLASFSIGTGVLSAEINQPEVKADHSPPTADFKNVRSQ